MVSAFHSLSALFNHVVNHVGISGGTLLLGSTALLAAGSLAVYFARSPVKKQRLADLTLMAALVWLLFAVVPLPRPAAFWWQSLASNSSDELVADDVNEIETGLAQQVEAAPIQDSSPSDAEFVDREATATAPPSPAGSTTVSAGQPTDEQARFAQLSPLDVLPAGFAAAWFAGMAGAIAWLSAGLVLLLRISRSSLPLPIWFQRLLESLPWKESSAKPRIVLSARIHRAMTWGVWRPKIGMPASICEPKRCDQLRHILLHELAHICRRDAWSVFLFNIALPIFYFHPLFWYLRGQSRLAAELLADDWAAGHSSPEDYAEQLIEFVKSGKKDHALAFAGLSIFESPSRFYRRMHMLLHRRGRLATHCAWSWRCATMFAFIFVTGLAISGLGLTPVAAQSDEEKTAESDADYKFLIERLQKLEQAEKVAADQQAAIDWVAVEQNDSDGELEKLRAAYKDLQKQVELLTRQLKEAKAKGQSWPVDEERIKAQQALAAEQADQAKLAWAKQHAAIEAEKQVRDARLKLENQIAEGQHLAELQALQAEKAALQAKLEALKQDGNNKEAQEIEAKIKATADQQEQKGAWFRKFNKGPDDQEWAIRQKIEDQRAAVIKKLEALHKEGRTDEAQALEAKFQAEVAAAQAQLQEATQKKEAWDKKQFKGPGEAESAKLKALQAEKAAIIEKLERHGYKSARKNPKQWKISEKSDPKNAEAQSFNRGETVSSGIDVLTLGTAMIDAQADLESAKLELSQVESLEVNKVIDPKTAGEAKIRFRRAERKVDLLTTMAESALAAAKEEHALVHQQFEAGTVSQQPLMQSEHRLRILEKVLQQAQGSEEKKPEPLSAKKKVDWRIKGDEGAKVQDNKSEEWTVLLADQERGVVIQDEKNGLIAILDAATKKLIRELKIGPAPVTGVQVQGDLLEVVSEDGNAWVFSLKTGELITHNQFGKQPLDAPDKSAEEKAKDAPDSEEEPKQK